MRYTRCVFLFILYCYGTRLLLRVSTIQLFFYVFYLDSLLYSFALFRPHCLMQRTS